MKKTDVRLKSISIDGFKSFGQKQEIELNQINILIGANGVGKSNFLSIFDLMTNIMNADLQGYVNKQGGADTFFYKGLKITDKVKLGFEFNNEFGYRFSLEPALPRDVVMVKEDLLKHGVETPALRYFDSLKAHRESVIPNRNIPYAFAESLGKYFLQVQDFHFVDTTEFAKIRGLLYENDCMFLEKDGRNLSAYLRFLKKNHKQHYERIIQRIRLIMPQFGDFVFSVKDVTIQTVNLDWTEKGSNQVFRSDQISDGALRFMALATLLLQPVEYLPPVIVIDEPELGLHPEAIMDFMGMVKIASQHSQIILATQSTNIVDCAGIEQIIVVERNVSGTVLKRLKETEFTEWLKNYNLSEIWDKNLIGGRP